MNAGKHTSLPWSTFRIIGTGWFLVALFLGETGILGVVPGPAPQIALWVTTLLLLGCCLLLPAANTLVMTVPLKALLAIHLTRLVGIYFLYLHSRGQLPESFAVPAGWGDIAAACGALVLILWPRLVEKRWLLLAWNTLALADILFVLSSGMRMTGADRYLLLEALTTLPLSFLPLMVVPLILTTHLLIYIRAWRSAPKTLPETGAAYAPSRPLSM